MIILCQHHKDHCNHQVKDQIQLRKVGYVKWKSSHTWSLMNWDENYVVYKINNTYWNDLRIVFDEVNEGE